MSIDDKTKEQLAKELFNATRNKCSLSCITIVYPNLTVSEAYQIQHQGILLRLEKGGKIVGFKMGLTSKVNIFMVFVFQENKKIIPS